MRKLFRIVILFCLVLALGGCAPQSKGDECIYITHQTYHEWQIWKVAIDGSESEMLYQLPRWISMDSLPGDELFTEEMKNQFQEDFTSQIVQEQFETYISVSLSPDKRIVIIEEEFLYCPGNWCDGQFSKRFINTETNEEILKYVSGEFITSPIWSNDSAMFVFNQLDDEVKAYTYTTHVWDVPTNQEVFVSSGEAASFIGDSHKILSKYYVDSSESSFRDTVCCQITDPLDGALEDKLISESTQLKSYLLESTLSFDGKKIALVAPLENFDEVRIVDFESLKVESSILTVNPDESIWKIGWSPNNRLIAIDCHKNFEHFLKILDSQSGEMLYALESVMDWQWSRNGDKILYFTQSLDNRCTQKGVAINILNVRDGTITLIELPEEIQNYMDSNDNNMICIRFISEVAW